MDVKEEEANDEESLDLQNPLPEGLAEEDANETEENPMPDDALEEGSFLYSWVVEGSSYLSTTAAPAITEALDMIESVRSRTFVSIYGGGQDCRWVVLISKALWCFLIEIDNSWNLSPQVLRLLCIFSCHGAGMGKRK